MLRTFREAHSSTPGAKDIQKSNSNEDPLTADLNPKGAAEELLDTVAERVLWEGSNSSGAFVET